MGKSVTPKYVVQINDGRGDNFKTPMTWNSRQSGRPTAANLEKYVKVYAKSLEQGGVNAHVSEALGFIPYPNSAEIRLNDLSRQVIATWKAAMFQVW